MLPIKIYSHIFLFGGVSMASTGPRGLELLTGASEQDTSTTSYPWRRETKQDWKQQCLPNLRRQLLLQDKHPNTYCIFKYIMIGPTSAFQKIYNRRTLRLLLRCLKWALGPGEKKKQREISISAQFVHAHFTRKMYILYKFKVPNFIQNCKSLTWSTPPPPG